MKDQSRFQQSVLDEWLDRHELSGLYFSMRDMYRQDEPFKQDVYREFRGNEYLNILICSLKAKLAKPDGSPRLLFDESPE